jgi:hypothetical protein
VSIYISFLSMVAIFAIEKTAIAKIAIEKIAIPTP